MSDHEPPTVEDRLKAAAKQLRLAREDATSKSDEEAIAELHVDTIEVIRRRDES
jgi:hypothetical protein